MPSSHYFSRKPSSRDERGRIDTILRGRNYSFITSTGVFSAKRIDTGTRVLVENMHIPSRGDFLDLGCGIGIIGIVAASTESNLRVHLTDVNERAVQLTKLNIQRAELSNCNVYEGYLYEALGDQKFDAIISNPPISAGMHKVVHPMVWSAYERLNIGGVLQMVIQSNKGGKMLAGFFDEVFGEHEVVAKKSGYRVLSSCKC
jgi:16S rRNA (guanine1207-N2)-methyltransferase